MSVMSWTCEETPASIPPVPSDRAGRCVDTGRWGERIAAEYLERVGWTVLERNYRLGRNEIDLIARQGSLIAFVEVKTRRSACFGHPLEGIDARKRAGIERVAAGWIQHRNPCAAAYRFDAVAVSGSPRSGGSRIEHVEGAWGL